MQHLWQVQLNAHRGSLQPEHVHIVFAHSHIIIVLLVADDRGGIQPHQRLNCDAVEIGKAGRGRPRLIALLNDNLAPCSGMLRGSRQSHVHTHATWLILLLAVMCRAI